MLTDDEKSRVDYMQRAIDAAIERLKFLRDDEDCAAAECIAYDSIIDILNDAYTRGNALVGD
jgi:hypothetical protein